MKQNITKTQWEELSSEEQNTLFYEVDDRLNEGQVLLLSIGQMIEFLGDDLDTIDNDWDSTIGENIWLVNFTANDKYISLKRKELADLLWEAVKYKLKNI